MLDETVPTLSLVIPVYNNHSSLEELVERISTACHSCCGSAFEVILVDDGSSDQSWKLMSELASSRVVAVRLSRNFGQHAALKAGFAHCRGQFVIMMDADLEDNPADIIPIFNKLKEGFDVCYTNLVANRQNTLRTTSKLFQKYANYSNKAIKGKNIGTMRGFNRKVLAAIFRFGERRPVYGPLITELGFKQAIVDVAVQDKKGRQSSYSFKKRMSLALDYIIGYTTLISKFFMIASTVAFLASLIYAIVIFVQYVLVGNQLPPGLSLIMIVLLLLFSILYFGIGVIGMYMQRILHENLQRPLYIVAETIGGLDKLEQGSGETTIVRRD